MVLDTTPLDRPELPVVKRREAAPGEAVVEMEPRAVHRTLDPRASVTVHRTRPDPKSAAAELKDRVAFWRGVDVRPANSA